MSKPRFACALFPNCPNREESQRRVLEEADFSEGFDEVVTHEWTEVFGPCEEDCYENSLKEAINHSVLVIRGNRVEDIGS